MSIRFSPVTRDNWLDVGHLELRPGQQEFVTPNFTSLAESRFFPELVPMAIYNEDMLIGFCMYGYDLQDCTWWLVRLMIDQQHQGHGYGRAALKAAMSLLRTLPGCGRIKASYDPENEAAGRLLASEGFRPSHEVLEGETVVVYDVPG